MVTDARARAVLAASIVALLILGLARAASPAMLVAAAVLLLGAAPLLRPALTRGRWGDPGCRRTLVFAAVMVPLTLAATGLGGPTWSPLVAVVIASIASSRLERSCTPPPRFVVRDLRNRDVGR